MLIEFTTSNFMSIKNDICLSLVADSSNDREDTHISVSIAAEKAHQIRLVHSAAIYGPNASGKTNLLLALSAMKDIVKNSFQSMNKLPVVPFAFDQQYQNQPSVFEVIFIKDGVRYQYGFSVTSSRVCKEWLFAWPRGRLQMWFERDYQSFSFGPRLQGPKVTWKSSTRPGSLFLSTAVALNCTQLKPVFDWFSESLHVFTSESWSGSFTTSLCRSDSESKLLKKTHVIDFLTGADFSIRDISVVDEEFSSESLPDDLPEEVRQEIVKDLAGKKISRIFFSHDTGKDKSAEIEMGAESLGTQKIFRLAGPWLDILNEGSTIAIDEIDTSLHTNLVKHLVKFFHNNDTNPRGAQLIFSTHNTSILNQEIFRRDQIWFCERNNQLETGLIPLTQFKPRKGFENLERSYLLGRYGAVPVFGR